MKEVEQYFCANLDCKYHVLVDNTTIVRGYMFIGLGAENGNLATGALYRRAWRHPEGWHIYFCEKCTKPQCDKEAEIRQTTIGVRMGDPHDSVQ